MKNRFSSTSSSAFTLVEVLASVAILAVLMVILLSITNETQAVWKRTQAKATQFREARNAFESINRRIRQATLNTYWDYDDPTEPTKYERRSELRFASGPVGRLGVNAPFSDSTAYGHAVFFQGPFGYSPDQDVKSLNKLLNTWGYYVALTNGKDELPGFIAAGAPDKWRMRLYEFAEPSDELTLLSVTSGDADTTSKDWFQTPLADEAYSHVLAENVIALIIRPKERAQRWYTGQVAQVASEVENIAPDYLYDSSGPGNLPDTQRAQLPPIVQVVLVAIDDVSAGLLTKAQLQELGREVDKFFRSRSKDMESNLLLDPNKANNASVSLENFLANHSPPINFRVYSSNINISGSKWSDTIPQQQP